MKLKLHHVNLCSTNVAAMNQFYRDVLDMEGEPTMARPIDHSSTAATATAAAAAISTMTEVSTRSPCQVMTTSPGRSASHTAPNASNATMTR